MQYFSLSLSSKLDLIINHLSDLGPEIVLTASFLLIILLELFTGKTNQRIVPKIALVCMILSFCASIMQFPVAQSFTNGLHGDPHATSKFFGMIRVDTYSVFFKVLFSIAGLLAVLMSMNYKTLDDKSKGTGEYYAILIAIVLGMNLMAMSANLLMMYIALEMVSIGSYILTSYTRLDHKSSESGVKYILFGAVASGAMVYGISLLYGFTGTLDIFNPVFLERLAKIDSLAVLIACLLTLSGFGYKIAMVPFHLWSPDVYEGAPTPITAFMSVGPKAAGFAMIVRFLFVFVSTKGSTDTGWANFNWVNSMAYLSMLTMTIGNFSAIWQNNVKRMLAYSSIAHAGYLLMGLCAITQFGISSIMFYLLIYTLMNVGVFLIIGMIAESIGSEDVRDYKGIGLKMPLIGVYMVIFLISLTGLPPTAGFVGKMFLFSAIFDSYHTTGNPVLFWLIIVGIINSVISLFYYFKIPLYMFLRQNDKAAAMKFSYPNIALASLLALSVIWLFIQSGFVMNYIEKSVLNF